MSDYYDDVVNAQLPTLEEYEDLFRVFTRYFQPRFVTMENVPQDRPCMFICNHSNYGVADTMAGIGAFRAGGSCPRGVGDRNQGKIKWMRDFHAKTGSIVGDKNTLGEIMQKGDNIILFPGGQREMFKKAKEHYTLIWKERLGFLRLAIEHDYLIIPMGVTGGEECYKVLADADDYLNTRLGNYLEKKGFFDKYMRGKDELPALVRGVGPTIIPRPQRIYTVFGKPIDVSSHKNKLDDKKKLLSVRNKVEKAVLMCIEEGHKARQEDPESESFWRKRLNAI